MSSNHKNPPEGLLIAGNWVTSQERLQVSDKYSQEIIGSVSSAGLADLEAAVQAASKAFPVNAKLAVHERADILERASILLKERKEYLATWITKEAGKAIKFSRMEVDRAVDTFHLAAQEIGRLHGETMPMDAVKSGQGLIGFWQRRPVGVVAAITPFNFPLNLVAHKIAPALAAGNAVVLKPAELTPFTAAILCQILIDAGLPPGCLNLIHGRGDILGKALISHPLINKVTFTGSAGVGRQILSHAGIKKVTLELGNASPVIIAHDADLLTAAEKCAIGANYCSGQVCISTQRIYVAEAVAEEFSNLLVEATGRLVIGNPMDEKTDVGPMISLKEAERVGQWVAEAKSAGAQIILGGRREGSVHWPTLLNQVRPEMKVIKDEVFGPVASVIPCQTFEDALVQADDTQYGLQASVFTKDIDRVFQAVSQLNFGGVVINDTPHLRPDHIPYGGNRQSGLGREGLRFALEEMTNIQMIMIRTSFAK
jgi:acyl-CoA reductase-like NAD-dependent aldehyde dehydrogenase